MRSVAVVVVSEGSEPSRDGRPTADPAGMEAVGANPEGMEPFFDVVPIGIVEPTAEV